MTALYAYGFYFGFAACITAYRSWVAGRLSLFNKLLFAPAIIAFALVDVLLNYTLLVLIFGPPDKHDYTISARFETYRMSYGFKRTVATFVCDRLSELDPSGRHC